MHWRIAAQFGAWYDYHLDLCALHNPFKKKKTGRILLFMWKQQSFQSKFSKKSNLPKTKRLIRRIHHNMCRNKPHRATSLSALPIVKHKELQCLRKIWNMQKAYYKKFAIYTLICNWTIYHLIEIIFNHEYWDWHWSICHNIKVSTIQSRWKWTRLHLITTTHTKFGWRCAFMK